MLTGQCAHMLFENDISQHVFLALATVSRLVWAHIKLGSDVQKITSFLVEIASWMFTKMGNMNLASKMIAILQYSKYKFGIPCQISVQVTNFENFLSRSRCKTLYLKKVSVTTFSPTVFAWFQQVKERNFETGVNLTDSSGFYPILSMSSKLPP